MWITGASSGIGKALAIEAAKAGYKIALTARREPLLSELKSQIVSNGAKQVDILVTPADVTNLKELQNSYRKICDSFQKVDILVANAGSHSPSSSNNFDIESYRELFDLNFFGALNCIGCVLADMRQRKSGQIVGVSSVAGYRALPTAAAYGASKSALTYFLESLRFDVEHSGIAVTVVSPGFVRTPLTDRNDFAMPFLVEPEYAANAILQGIERKSFEIHFPKRFTLLLKLLGLLPKRVYHRLVNWSVKIQ